MSISYFNTEKFYRLSYDCFHYANNIDEAKKYLQKALKITPEHFKSLVLKGEILLYENNPLGALECFLKAEKLNPQNPKCLFCIASTYELISDYKLGYEYLNKITLNKIKDKEFLSKCYMLKIGLLIKLNKCKQAKNTLKTLNRKLYSDDVFDIEEAFYNMIKNNNNAENDTKRVLHINF